MEIGEKLKERRMKMGLTMREVAEKANVSEATVSRWESGDIANMRRNKIVLLAKALQVSPAYIMGWDDEQEGSKETDKGANKMEGFGERLVKARLEKGLTQKAFAEMLEISPTRLNYWEKDKREPDLFMFNKIVSVLGIDANELLGLKFAENSIDTKKYNSLNASGKQKADEYINDLTENPKYTSENNIADDIINELKQIANAPMHDLTPHTK